MTQDKRIENDLNASMVIIGGGGSGLAAAVAAAEKGVRNIIVLEKHGLGGNSAMAFNLFAADSPEQKRRNIDCSRDACYKIAMNFAHWKINPRIVRALIDKSGETIGWLEKKGVQFSCNPDLFQFPADALPSPHRVIGGGATLIKALIQDCKTRGVQTLTQTPAQKIIMDSQGKITGVIAQKKSGEEFTIRTNCVIVATGGFGGNREFLKKYCAYYYDGMICDGIPHNGDGFRMATEIGADTAGLGTLLSSGPCIPRTAVVAAGDIRIGLKGIGGDPEALWVNKKGERYTDEAIALYHYEVANAMSQQPGMISYSLYDGRMMQKMLDEGRNLGMGLPGEKPAAPVRKISLTELAAVLQQKAGNKVWVKVAYSWNEIARWIGADPARLKATIDEYNSACDNKHDPIFAKEPRYLVPLRTPPYFAIEGEITYVNTLGGIKINERMEVLDKEGQLIPGLYAAGVDTGGWESEIYCSRLSGHAYGFAINSGRIAGESAANQILAT